VDLDLPSGETEVNPIPSLCRPARAVLAWLDVSKPRYRSALLLGLVCWFVGCQSNDLPEVEWVGEHIAFAPENPEQVCAGTREYLDQRAGEMLERLGSDPIQIEYYLLDDVSEHCPSKAYGCGHEGVVYAETVPLLHEIVHARSGAFMPPVLEEGLATYFGDPFPLYEMASRERLAERLRSNGRLTSGAEYARAGHFVAFLVESFGWESMLELDDQLSRESSPAQLDGAFQSIFGFDVAGALEAYQAFPDCWAADTSLACTSDPLPTVYPFFVAGFEHVVDCESVSSIGPHYGMVFVEGVIEVAPSIDGGRIVSAMGDGAAKGGFAVIRRCGPCSENGVMRTRGNSSYLVPEDDLPAGRYVVRLYLPVDAGPATLGVLING
jgi:hypothetical protein